MNKTPEQRSALGLPSEPTNNNRTYFTAYVGSPPILGVVAIYALGCLMGIFLSICAFLYLTS